MPWARFDDQYDRNRKVLAVSPAARWLHVASVTSCRRQNSRSGFMTELEARGLAVAQGVPVRCIKELVAVGLWDALEGGYSVHDYPEYLPAPSSERVARHRQRKAEQSKESAPRNADVTVTDEGGNTPRARAWAQGPIPIPIPPSGGSSAPDGASPLPGVNHEVHEEKASSTRAVDPETRERVQRIFEAEVAARVGKGPILLTPKRATAAERRLKQGYGLEDCIDAVRACCADDWCRRTGNDNMAYALRDGETLERFRNKARCAAEPASNGLRASGASSGAVIPGLSAEELAFAARLRAEA